MKLSKITSVRIGPVFILVYSILALTQYIQKEWMYFGIFSTLTLFGVWATRKRANYRFREAPSGRKRGIWFGVDDRG